MMNREPVHHGLTEKPRSRRSSPTRSRSMMSNDRPNLLSSSSFHWIVIAGGAVMTMKSILPPQQQLARDEASLDRLAQTDVVGDQQIHPRQPQRLSQRQQLIGIEPNAGAERRLQQIPVGGRRRTPADCAQICGENLGAVRRSLPDARPGVLGQDAKRRFRRPTGLRSARPGRRRRCRRAGAWSDPAPSRRPPRRATAARAPRRSFLVRSSRSTRAPTSVDRPIIQGRSGNTTVKSAAFQEIRSRFQDTIFPPNARLALPARRCVARAIRRGCGGPRSRRRPPEWQHRARPRLPPSRPPPARYGARPDRSRAPGLTAAQRHNQLSAWPRRRSSLVSSSFIIRQPEPRCHRFLKSRSWFRSRRSRRAGRRS